MSGENIYNLVKEPVSHELPVKGKSNYRKHFEEQTKPPYSTFYEKGKEYDGSHARYFKQRDAIIGKQVAQDVHPDNFLKAGNGVKHIVPPIEKKKVFRKAAVDQNKKNGNNDYPLGQEDMSDAAGSYPGNGRGDMRGNHDGQGIGDGDGNYPDGSGYPTAGLHGADHLSTYPRGGEQKDSPKKNFIRSNAVDVTNMVPKRQKAQPENYTASKTFGRAPAYLTRVKDELQREKSYVNSLHASKVEHRQQVMNYYVYQLQEEERRRLFNALQRQLEKNMAEYTQMPFSKDTLTMVRRKAELEKSSKDIEVAIKKLDKEAVFVYRDDPVNGDWAKNMALKEARRYASNQ